ncbi:MAG: nitronate monooxygenase [Reyranella sp.]|nr:MAG: nitronate monooxygenase [Reyranella sp.]
MKTVLCEKLGIEVPIILAPMGLAAGPRLAAAVSNAGGLGTLAPWLADIDVVRRQIRETRTLTSRPFAVNLNMAYPQEERLEACLEEGAPAISFFWHDPGKLVARAKAGGAVVLQTVGNASDARAAADNGVDIVVAQGWEAGGHVCGTVATLPLIPAVVDAVGPVPVVAAGGIADARGLAAVLALGAAGAWIGTRFLAAREAAIHPEYQACVLAATENDTAYLEDLFDIETWPAAPHRALRNSTVMAWEAAGRPPAGKRPGEGDVLAALPNGRQVVRYRGSTPVAGVTGAIEALSMWAGQSVALVRKVLPAAEIVREINDGSDAILRRLSGQLAAVR